MSTRAKFAVLLVVTAALRCWMATSLPLSGDEAYHWEWSRRLAPAYWDHPGLTAWLIWLSARVLPAESELMVRMPALVCLLVTAVICRDLARRITVDGGGSAENAERAGLIAGLMVLWLPIYAVLSVYMSTDPPLLACVALTVYLSYRAMVEGRWWQWLGAGVALGLAASAKFLAFSLIPALAVALLAHRSLRRWLVRPQPWVALALAVAVFSPVLAWNASHDWATFRFNFVLRNAHAHLQPLRALEFIASQALVLSPVVFVLLIPALRDGVRAWRRGSVGATVLLATSLLPLGALLASSFLRRAGMHWAAAGWLPLLVWAATTWARPEPSRARWPRRALAIGVAMTAALHLLAHVPHRWTRFDLAYVGHPERIRVKAMDERFGWRRLGARLAAVRAEMEAKGRKVFFFGEQYGVAAAAAFYIPGQPEVYLCSDRRVHGENYRYWEDLDALRGQDAIAFSKYRERLEERRHHLGAHFDSVGPLEEIVIREDGEVVRSFWFVRATRYDGKALF